MYYSTVLAFRKIMQILYQTENSILDLFVIAEISTSNRTVTRGAQGGEDPLENFSIPWKKVLEIV